MEVICKEKIRRLVRYSKKYQNYRLKKRMRNTPFMPDSPRYIYQIRGEDKYAQFQRMLQEIQIEVRPEKCFQHWIDENLIVYHDNKLIGNIPPDFGNVVDHSIFEWIEINGGEDEISKKNRQLLISVLEYINRIIFELKKQIKTEHILHAITSFENMKTESAKTMDEALQRILFWSSLFWQSGHKLVGLGRLDKVLARFEDENKEEEYLWMIKDFLLCLHEHYAYKSSQLLGDIGQIVILGGLEEDNTYFCNQITFLFLKAVAQLQIPDPKLLLRVANIMPKKLLTQAIQCIETGVGSPLLSNDEVVIPALLDFGYQREDAYGYVTSACWEPVSYGNSLEQNNLNNINFADPFVRTLCEANGEKIKVYEDFQKLYEKNLRKNIHGVLQQISKINWEPDPLFTLFTKGCVESGKDISLGGAVYNDYGILSVGIGNTVNSLLNIKEMVFEKKIYSLNELSYLWSKSESKELESLSRLLLKKDGFWGHDTRESISLTNRLLQITSEEVSNYRNKYGGKVKYGLSSPNYITRGNQTGYTFDGRKAGESLMVHISAGRDTPYTELISFAAQLSYTAWNSNANVVDYFISPDFIERNFEKFVRFVQLSIQKGFYQMQMNVVGSATLLAAKNNPEKFPNLIVRVWGFSAYFKDLPEEYQDVLIHRALISEGKADDQ